MASTTTHAAHHQGPAYGDRPPVRHTWVRAGDAELITHVHVPADGRARSVVVLADGLMREQITGFRTYFLLADELARRGILAIRFAWSGTSDSSAADPADERTVTQRWSDDLAHMCAYAHTAAPGVPLTLFGLRAAGLLATRFSQDHPGEVDQILWWEPVGSGRTWLRGQETLHKMSTEYSERVLIPDLPPGSVEVPGHLFTPRDADAMRALTATGTGGARLDAVIRPDLAMDRRLKALLAHADSVTEVAGQAEALDVATMIAVVSRPTVDALADAAEAVAAPTAVEVALPAMRQEAVVATVTVRGQAQPVTERIVDAGGVYGIVTQAVGTPTRAVLSLPGSSDPMAGPTWLWTDLNRRLAARGTTSLRADRCRVGEHIDTADLSDPWPYRASAVEDVTASYEWFRSSTGLEPTIYGMCSGSWIACHVAARAHVPTVIAINQIAWDIEALPQGNPVPTGFDPPTIGQTFQPVAASTVQKMTILARERLKRYAPYPVWRVLARRGAVQMAEPLYEMATASGTRLHLIMCANDLMYGERQQLRHAVRALVWAGRPITLIRRLRLDHSMLSDSSRRQAVHDVMALVNRTPARHPRTAGAGATPPQT